MGGINIMNERQNTFGLFIEQPYLRPYDRNSNTYATTNNRDLATERLTHMSDDHIEERLTYYE